MEDAPDHVDRGDRDLLPEDAPVFGLAERPLDVDAQVGLPRVLEPLLCSELLCAIEPLRRVDTLGPKRPEQVVNLENF